MLRLHIEISQGLNVYLNVFTLTERGVSLAQINVSTMWSSMCNEIDVPAL